MVYVVFIAEVPLHEALDDGRFPNSHIAKKDQFVLGLAYS